MSACGAAAAPTARLSGRATARPGVYHDGASRGGLPSDDEDGPLEHDDAADARAPDEVLDGEEVQEMDTEPTEPVTAAPAPPSEPPDLQKITVPLIKEHLMWRGVKPRAGNKAEVLEQLRGVVEQPYVSRGQYVAAGGRATAALAQPRDAADPLRRPAARVVEPSRQLRHRVARTQLRKARAAPREEAAESARGKGGRAIAEKVPWWWWWWWW